MPSRDDYEAASERLRAASERLDALAAAADGIDTGAIVRGGSLASELSQQVASCAATGHTCAALLVELEATCRQRAGLIADYESRLATFDMAQARFEELLVEYNAQYNGWFHSGGQIPHPGAPPIAPPKPAPPPAWADVRRP